MPHAYTEDQLVEQPAIGLFAELGWTAVSVLENLGANGATMGNVSNCKFKSMAIVCSSDDLLAHYDRLVEQMFAEILSLFRQVQNLRRTRDLLLPRLLSGQVNLAVN